MIEAAERAGLLKPGGTIIEPTSGNTGPRPRHRRRAQGLPLHLRHGRQAVGGEAGAAARVRRRGRPVPDQRRPRVARELLLRRRPPRARHPGRVQARPVLERRRTPTAHERTTGPEIWAQTDGRITHLVASVGTGGTVSGIARYLRAQNPALRVIGADPEGSVLSGDTARPYLTEGVGEDFFPGTYDRSVGRPLGARLRPRRVRDGPPDHARGGDPRRRVVRDGDAGGARRGAHGSCARSPTAAPDAVVVVILARRRPELPLEALQRRVDARQRPAADDRRGRPGRRAARASATTASRCPTSCSPGRPTASGAAIDLLQRVRHQPAARCRSSPTGRDLAGIVGSVSEKGLLDRAYRNPEIVERTVGEVMDRPLPTLDTSRDRRRGVRAAVGGAAALLAVRGGRPGGRRHQARPARVPAHHRGAPERDVPTPDGRTTPIAAAATRSTRCAVHAGAEPDELTGRRLAADLPDHDLRPGRRRPAARRLRVRPQPEPDPRAPRAGGRGPRGRPPRDRVRERLGGDRGDRPARRAPARRSSSATTSTAARTATSSACTGRPGGGSRELRRPRVGRPDALWEGLTERTRLVWLETPSNPLLKVIDIAAVGRDRPRPRGAGGPGAAAARRRQHVRVARAPAAARARRGHRVPLGHEVPRRALGHGPRRRGHDATTRSPSGCGSSRTRWAACPGRSTASSCCAACGRSPCGWSATARTRLAVARFLAARDDVAWVSYPGLDRRRHAHPRARGRRAPDAPRRRAGVRRHGLVRAGAPAAPTGARRPSGRSRSARRPGCSPSPSRSAASSR